MTSIPPSQEAREAAADLQELRVALNTGRGLKDSATVYRFQVLLDTFEAQIEARRTPPSDELRERAARRIEPDLWACADAGETLDEWQQHMLDWSLAKASEIIALLPGGGGERSVDAVAKAIYETMARLFGDRLDLETPWASLSEEARQQGHEIARAAIAAAPTPTIPTDLVERLQECCEADAARHEASLLKGFSSVRTSDLLALLDAIEGKKS